METLEFAAAPVRSRWRGILAAILVVVLVLPVGWVAFLLLAPSHLEYTVEEGGLTVTLGPEPFLRRRSWSPEQIADSGAVDLPPGRRVAGTVLPGYCVGTFSYRGLGKVWQATDCSARAVLLRIRDGQRPVVLTPPDREAFLSALREGGRYHHLAPVVRSPVRTFFQVMALLGVAAALLVPALLVTGPGRIRYALEPGRLVIRTFFARRSLPLEGLRARVLRAPRLAARLWGVAYPGYATGLFRMEGRTVRVAATDLTGDCVLLEGGGRPVLLTPADPRAFLEALRLVGVGVEEARWDRPGYTPPDGGTGT